MVQREVQAVPLIDKILRRAVREEASDIHLEPKESELRIRFRVDGVLQERNALPDELSAPLVSRIKVLAGMDIAEKRVPQDGTLTVVSGRKEVSFRASTFPTCWGEKVVLRVLNSGADLLKIERLGVPSVYLPVLQEAVGRPSGMILATGPTGSGKTSTLYALLESVDQVSRNIVTLEDPIEVRIPRLTQAQTNVRAGFTFANGLRALLRQDPDVILVGEMRDEETSEIALRAALTGHLVLSTLHTSSTIETIARLLDMGLEPFVVSSALSLIVSQRLVRRLCEHCKTASSPPAKLDRILGFTPEVVPRALLRAVGCAECNYTGYSGRIGLFEIVTIDDEMRDMMKLKSPTHEYRQHFKRRNIPSLRRAGWERVCRGETAIEEIMRVC